MRDLLHITGPTTAVGAALLILGAAWCLLALTYWAAWRCEERAEKDHRLAELEALMVAEYVVALEARRIEAAADRGIDLVRQWGDEL